ncbi:pyridoxine biosynthesis protein [Maudiozyma exigua]|uniref:Pyridoxine biosynthesis protein n=1 Tax=Maudiozyma exigua TaxID=34358 RepID=A0A9P6WC07_MAUEX|nr:pyridoxine biosynthesis protein [Kazachstania exigua]
MFRAATTKVISRQGVLCRLVANAGLHSSKTSLAIKPYAMPAMSPTMEIGGIVDWKVAAGQEYSAGDDLLEIETDKAQIDVEALDDGKLVKILKGNGTKDIAVGTNIAYIADVDDDISNIDLNALEAESTGSPSRTKKEGTEEKVTEVKKVEANTKSLQVPSGKYVANREQTLLPSVSILLAENGISKEKAISEIPATGLNGTLLKGDVLSYLGTIPTNSSVDIEQYIDKFRHIDLTGIEKTVLKAQPQETSTVAPEAKETAPLVPKKVEDTLLEHNISMDIPNSISYDTLYSSTKSFLQEAYQYAHLGDPTQMQSEHYDPIFEDLVATDPRSSRFQYTFTLKSSDEYQGTKPYKSDDLFDILLSSKRDVVPKSTEPKFNNYILSVDVEVNGKYTDCREKADLFLDYVNDLQDVQM